MNVKDSIRKRLNKSFAIIAAVCSAGLIACGVALFVISMQYHSAIENYGFHRAILVRQWQYLQIQGVP